MSPTLQVSRNQFNRSHSPRPIVRSVRIGGVIVRLRGELAFAFRENATTISERRPWPHRPSISALAK